MRKQLIGLCGRAGSGKTTLRTALVWYYDGWYGASFAAPIRAMLETLLRARGLSSEEAHDFLQERKHDPCPALNGHTPRYALQTLGTEWGRKCMGNVWLSVARREILYRRQRGESLVFDDVRFPDEAALIREYNGLVVRIVRPSTDGVVEATHDSETALDGITPDLVIANTDADEWAFAERAAAEVIAAAAGADAREQSKHQLNLFGNESR